MEMQGMFAAHNGAGNGDRGFTITVTGPTLTLQGYLAGDGDCRYCIKGALEFVARFPDIQELTIDTTGCWVIPEGELAWIDGVDRFLSSHRLHYTDGQLALILQCDERYKHEHSTYEVPV